VEGTEPSRSVPKNRYVLAAVLVGAEALVGAVLLALAYAGVFNSGQDADGGQDTGASRMITLFGHFDSPSGDFSAMLTTPPVQASIANLVIPKVDVDAPVGAKGVDAHGRMESADGPWDVVWYDFTAQPGFGSNAVFGGHVDYVNVGPAVFWRLRDLVQGDMIEVRLKDGSVYRYRVAAMATVDVDAAASDIFSVVGPTEREVITLITCDGTFDKTIQTYDQRLIVRAERMAGSAPGPAPH